MWGKCVRPVRGVLAGCDWPLWESRVIYCPHGPDSSTLSVLWKVPGSNHIQFWEGLICPLLLVNLFSSLSLGCCCWSQRSKNKTERKKNVKINNSVGKTIAFVSLPSPANGRASFIEIEETTRHCSTTRHLAHIPLLHLFQISINRQHLISSAVTWPRKWDHAKWRKISRTQSCRAGSCQSRFSVTIIKGF